MSNNILDVDLDSEISVDEVLKVLTKAKNGKAIRQWIPGIRCRTLWNRCNYPFKPHRRNFTRFKTYIKQFVQNM
jgi:hypothetical protein